MSATKIDKYKYYSLSEKLKILEANPVNSKIINNNHPDDPKPKNRNKKYWVPWIFFPNDLGLNKSQSIKKIYYWKTGWKPKEEIDFEKALENSQDFKETKKELENTKFYEKFIKKSNWSENFNINELKTPPEVGKIKSTWLGHATFFIQFSNGFNCLIDPVLSDIIGVGRETKVPVNISDLKIAGINIDLILISHTHYDHLEFDLLTQLEKDFPEAKFVFPKDVKKLFKTSIFQSKDNSKSRMAKKTTELMWWESFEVKGEEGQNMKITLTPAQHYSNRTLFDAYDYLWGGFVIENLSDQTSLYFVGDSGYCPVFKEIGQTFPNLTVSLIPIGAYKPRWFMSPQHCNPEESVQIHLDLKCKQSVAMHWLTFSLADDKAFEPLVEFEVFRKRRGVENFEWVEIGETRFYEK